MNCLKLFIWNNNSKNMFGFFLRTPYLIKNIDWSRCKRRAGVCGQLRVSLTGQICLLQQYRGQARQTAPSLFIHHLSDRERGRNMRREMETHRDGERERDRERCVRVDAWSSADRTSAPGEKQSLSLSLSSSLFPSRSPAGIYCIFSSPNQYILVARVTDQL